MKKQYPFAIKDWKKPEQYPDSNAMSKQELAWEFIRRNPDYQSNYDDLKDSEWQISPDETAKDWAEWKAGSPRPFQSLAMTRIATPLITLAGLESFGRI